MKQTKKKVAYRNRQLNAYAVLQLLRQLRCVVAITILCVLGDDEHRQYLGQVVVERVGVLDVHLIIYVLPCAQMERILFQPVTLVVDCQFLGQYADGAWLLCEEVEFVPLGCELVQWHIQDLVLCLVVQYGDHLDVEVVIVAVNEP